MAIYGLTFVQRIVDGTKSNRLLQPLVLLPSMQGPGVCDHNALERTVNIITSLPYAFVGLHALKHRKSTEGKLWGASLVGVTGGAVAFHASYGKARNLCRKIDYWCIAISSTMLFRAVFPEAPAYYSLMSLMSTPFQPFHVSTANVAAMEIEFMRRAGKDSSLKRTHHKHLAASVVGTSCFFIEDISPTLPMVHAAWHGMSTYATATCNHLIAAVENDRFAQ